MHTHCLVLTYYLAINSCCKVWCSWFNFPTHILSLWKFFCNTIQVKRESGLISALWIFMKPTFTHQFNKNTLFQVSLIQYFLKILFQISVLVLSVIFVQSCISFLLLWDYIYHLIQGLGESHSYKVSIRGAYFRGCHKNSSVVSLFDDGATTYYCYYTLFRTQCKCTHLFYL